MPHHLNPGIEDHRSLLSKFRRKELEAVLDHKGFQYPSGIPAISAREILRTAGIDGREYVDAKGQFIMPEQQSGGVDVDSMKITDLRKFCAQYGIAWNMKNKKVELQEKVREYLRG